MVTAIVGGNWGDEGKGKITDLLAQQADIVIRFQGGANAGHTIINEHGRFALHLLPSGIFSENAVNLIGPGVALNLESLFSELDEILAAGIAHPRLLISDRAQILMPHHVLFDKLEEQRLGKNSFGSTKSGIAPFYSDKYSKIGIQVCEIFDDSIKERLERICETKNILLRELYGSGERLDPEKLYTYLASFRERLAPMVCNSAELLHRAVRDERDILLEGQLGSLRDPDNGIYPFVTSSSPLAGFGSVGAAGIPPHEIKKVITVVKAYSSCVGAGAFVTEIFGDEAAELRERGGDKGEYGATTHRPRRMGWFDAVASRYGCILQGATDVVLSLVDVLGYLDKIPVCTGYEIDGKVTGEFPPTPLLNRAKPVYEYLEGWKSDTRGIREYEKLPAAARAYVEFVEEKLGFPVTMVSNGPRREDIIYR